MASPDALSPYSTRSWSMSNGKAPWASTCRASYAADDAHEPDVDRAKRARSWDPQQHGPTRTWSSPNTESALHSSNRAHDLGTRSSSTAATRWMRPCRRSSALGMTRRQWVGRWASTVSERYSTPVDVCRRIKEAQLPDHQLSARDANPASCRRRLCDQAGSLAGRSDGSRMHLLLWRRRCE